MADEHREEQRKRDRELRAAERARRKAAAAESVIAPMATPVTATENVAETARDVEVASETVPISVSVPEILPLADDAPVTVPEPTV